MNAPFGDFLGHLAMDNLSTGYLGSVEALLHV